MRQGTVYESEHRLGRSRVWTSPPPFGSQVDEGTQERGRYHEEAQCWPRELPPRPVLGTSVQAERAWESRSSGPVEGQTTMPTSGEADGTRGSNEVHGHGRAIHLLSLRPARHLACSEGDIALDVEIVQRRSSSSVSTSLPASGRQSKRSCSVVQSVPTPARLGRGAFGLSVDEQWLGVYRGLQDQTSVSSPDGDGIVVRRC